MDLFFIIGLISSIIVAFLITLKWLNKGMNPLYERVLNHLIRKYLDERYFTVHKLADELNITEDTLRRILKTLEARRIVAFIPHKKQYALLDPLVFLTPKDYARALRITKDDNILYGAYEAPYRVDILYILIQLIFILVPLLAFFAQVLNMIDLSPYLTRIFPNARPEVILLFFLGMGIILADAVNNVIKGYTREKMSVVVGALSGISYDKHFADELSGRLPRKDLKSVDIRLSLLQKIHNYFGEIPVGDIIVEYRGGKKPEVFRSMPFPRELFYVIRSIMLGHLEWRKRHAETISKWKAGSLPTVPMGRRSRRGR